MNTQQSIFNPFSTTVRYAYSLSQDGTITQEKIKVNRNKKESHIDIFRRYLSDGQWHSMPELMERFQRENHGAFWAGLRASDLHKRGLLVSRPVKNENYVEYKLLE